MGGGVVSGNSNVAHDPHFVWNFTLFFILGVLNYFGFTVILSAAKTLADHFNAENQLGWIPWANIAAGYIVRPLNIVIERVPISLRIFANGIVPSHQSRLPSRIHASRTHLHCIGNSGELL